MEEQAKAYLMDKGIDENKYESTAQEIFNLMPDNMKAQMPDIWTAVLRYGDIYFGMCK